MGKFQRADKGFAYCDPRGATMKRIHEEIRILRQQMEEDFLLHSERIAAQTQSIERVEGALSEMQHALTEMKRATGALSQEFREFSSMTRSSFDLWSVERKRTMQILDRVQTGLLTSDLETDSRLDRIEGRLSRLEGGAA
ncbi:hypothetical protein ABS71_12240 [bacterium SCN 62-11]|nr:MAG: hypothetical protein ABS71_12240 [bacterium SCN 62-11]